MNVGYIMVPKTDIFHILLFFDEKPDTHVFCNLTCLGEVFLNVFLDSRF